MSSDLQPMYIYNSIRNRIKFSKYLFGSFFGFFWGVVNSADTFISRRHKNKNRKVRFKLWLGAVFDELLGQSLDRVALQKVKEKFKN